MKVFDPKDSRIKNMYYIRFLRNCNNFVTKMKYKFKIAYKPLK